MPLTKRERGFLVTAGAVGSATAGTIRREGSDSESRTYLPRASPGWRLMLVLSITQIEETDPLQSGRYRQG
ncbi:MAG: hypothetical protein WB239_15495 [Acidimicrobiia bacterium]